MKTANFPPYAEISWLEDIQTLKVKWIKQHMKLSEFEEIIECAYGMLKENGGYIWVSDMYESEGVFPKDILNYMLEEESTIKSTAAGLRWALTVMPKSAGLASLSTKTWSKEVKKIDSFLVEEFSNWEVCKEWIQNQLSNQ